MIIHKFNPKIGYALVTPEEGEDLWDLRRIIEIDDLIASETTRVIKQQGDFTRPDKGERISVKLTIRAEQISLDSSLDRLRVKGLIAEAPEDFPSKHGYHSTTISIGKRIGIRKKKWNSLQSNLPKGSTSNQDIFLIISIDSRESGISQVKGTHVNNFPNIQSGASGKFYGNGKINYTNYFEKVHKMLEIHMSSKAKIIISGPGNVKNSLSNYLNNKFNNNDISIILIEGIDLAGEDGVRQTLRSEKFNETLQDSKMAKSYNILEEFMKRMANNDQRIAMGYNDVNNAANQGAIESIIVSDRIFVTVEEKKVVNLLNDIEKQKGKVYFLDSSTDLGKQVSSLGGFISLLRYKIN